MLTTRAALSTFFAALAMASNMDGAMAADGEFSYNPAADNGPANWGAVPVDGNACNGQKNSPIAVTTGKCDRFEDYTFSVSVRFVSYTLSIYDFFVVMSDLPGVSFRRRRRSFGLVCAPAWILAGMFCFSCIFVHAF